MAMVVTPFDDMLVHVIVVTMMPADHDMIVIAVMVAFDVLMVMPRAMAVFIVLG